MATDEKLPTTEQPPDGCNPYSDLPYPHFTKPKSTNDTEPQEPVIVEPIIEPGPVITD